MVLARRSLAGALALLASACLPAAERQLRGDLERGGQQLAELPDFDAQPLGDDWDSPADFDGSPEAYVEYALAHDRSLRASWERWRAATHRIASERRLPMPSITYGGFVSSVETRVGPQRHRLSVRQSFPWPGVLTAGADAAAMQARVMQREFEAAALEVRARVLTAYWRLWAVRGVRAIQAEQAELLEALSEAARARLTIGKASLADVQQLDLGRARLDDAILGLDEAEHEAAAMLLASVGAPPQSETPTRAEPPELELPSQGEAQLRGGLADHPRLARWRDQAAASDLRVREARNARLPGFAFGVDWIEVGPARMPNVADSGKDAVVINVGIELPLWQSNYAQDQKAHQADAAAARAEWAAARDRAAADLAVALSSIRDSARRATLHERTLIPQAQGVLESQLGEYVSGQSELAAILLAERDLLELRLELVRIHANHAIAWAELERIAGRSVDGASEPEPARPEEESNHE